MSFLAQVKKGREMKPAAILTHAPHGLGKTHLADMAPNPIFVGEEENDEIDSARMPKVKTWEDLEAQLAEIRDGEHDFKTLVIDTVDGLQRVAESKILSMKDGKGKTMATAFGGFGKAYERMQLMFKNLRNDYIIPIRENRGMNIILLCHSSKEKFEDPMTNTSYDMYETALHKKVKPIFEDWVSAIFFINYNRLRAENSDGKEYAEGDSTRIIFTEERPSHVAKNRFEMPPEIQYDKETGWKDIRKYILAYFKNAKKEEPKKKEETHDLEKQCEELISKLPDEMAQGFTSKLKKSKGSKDKLEKIISQIETALS